MRRILGDRCFEFEFQNQKFEIEEFSAGAPKNDNIIINLLTALRFKKQIFRFKILLSKQLCQRRMSLFLVVTKILYIKKSVLILKNILE